MDNNREKTKQRQNQKVKKKEGRNIKRERERGKFKKQKKIQGKKKWNEPSVYSHGRRTSFTLLRYLITSNVFKFFFFSLSFWPALQNFTSR